MKKLTLTFVLMAMSFGVFAKTNSMQILNGSRTDYYACRMVWGNAVDSAIITQLQSSEVFFRIIQGNGDFTPQIVLTNVDERGIANSNPVQFDVQDCELVKRCIDQFSSNEVSVASSCSAGLLKAKFIKN